MATPKKTVEKFVVSTDAKSALAELKKDATVYSRWGTDEYLTKAQAITAEFERFLNAGNKGVGNFLRICVPSFPTHRDTENGKIGYKNHPLASAFSHMRDVAGGTKGKSKSKGRKSKKYAVLLTKIQKTILIRELKGISVKTFNEALKVATS